MARILIVDDSPTEMYKLTAMLEPRSFGEFSKVVQQRSKRNTCCLVG